MRSLNNNTDVHTLAPNLSHQIICSCAQNLNIACYWVNELMATLFGLCYAVSEHDIESENGCEMKITDNFKLWGNN